MAVCVCVCMRVCGTGGYVIEMLTDPATITSKESDLISWQDEWVGGVEVEGAGDFALYTRTQLCLTPTA